MRRSSVRFRFWALHNTSWIGLFHQALLMSGSRIQDLSKIPVQDVSCAGDTARGSAGALRSGRRGVGRPNLLVVHNTGRVVDAVARTHRGSVVADNGTRVPTARHEHDRARPRANPTRQAHDTTTRRVLRSARAATRSVAGLGAPRARRPTWNCGTTTSCPSARWSRSSQRQASAQRHRRPRVSPSTRRAALE